MWVSDIMQSLNHANNSVINLSVSNINPNAIFAWARYFLVIMLAVLVVGCGGGNSGEQNSTTASVAAVAGPIIAIRVGETAILDGSKSFTSLPASLNLSWSFVHKPDDSKTTLIGETTTNPSFTADVKGVYTVDLVASANGVSSQRAVQIVIVTLEGESATGPFNHVGLSSNCVSCHDGILVSPGKSPDHIATSNMCQTCHTPQGSAIIPFADHQEVFGECSECHNGVKAIGKSEFHIQTDAECDNCHNTTSFLDLALDGSFDHSNITRSCAGCHDGEISKGKHEQHIVTNVDCSSCHNKESFLNAFPDHTDPAIVDNGCDSCHGVANGQGGLIAKGTTVGHPIVNVDCVSCHSIRSFKMTDGIFNHRLLDALVQPCESCHNDSNSINARGKGSAVNHPDTTSDCGVCHNTETFNPAFGFDHTGVTTDCAVSGCHDGSSGGATFKPITTPFYEHMPTNEDCSVCHTPGTFSTGTYDHGNITNGCNACHNNVIGVGKLPNHIPTNPDGQDCGDCHVTTSFADVTFDHTSTDTSNCLACHDGDLAKGKSFGHVDTAENCSTCHSVTGNNFSTFVNTFSHNASVVNGNCASCHNTGIATPKKVNHIPAQGECSQCHSDTNIGGFTSNTFLGGVHSGISGGCEGCHTDRVMLPNHPDLTKNSAHLPTVQDCDVCHTITSFMAPTNFTHAGITGSCTSCHGGGFVATGALAKTPNHPATTQDCGVCHNTNSFADATFDHTGRVSNCNECHANGATGAVTKKNSGHVVTNEDCSVCHVPGTFKNATFDHTGIVNNCVSCHDGSGAIATVKNSGHLPTNEDCSVCHNTTAFAGASFDHQGIVDNCVLCHDGATARGKTPPPNHVPTNEDCSVCHQTTGFSPAAFAHTGIVDNCVSCHDGKFATGKNTNHVATNQDCSVCHTTSQPLSFTGAVFDHTGIVDNCESCHDGSVSNVTKASKTNPPHLDTALDCSSCHTTATFKGGTWVHDSSTANNCDTCHVNGGGAPPKSNGHLNTNEQCDVCHTTNGWAPTNFKHSSQGNYPGDHRRDPGCTGCHKGSIGGGINSDNYPNQLQYAPDCAGCHAKDFERKGDHIGGKNGTVSQNRNCAGSGCHKVRDKDFD